MTTRLVNGGSIAPHHPLLIINHMGAISGGKGRTNGLLVKHLRSVGFKVNCITVGELIRDRLESDPEFRRQHGKTIYDGFLLCDEETIPMFEADLAAKYYNCDILTTDGYFRRISQVRNGQRNGLLRPQDVTIINNARLRCCWERYQHRLERLKEQGMPRPEGNVFRNRYNIYWRSIEEIEAEIKKVARSHTVKTINGNRDLETIVYPEMKELLAPWINSISPRSYATATPVQASVVNRSWSNPDGRTVSTL